MLEVVQTRNTLSPLEACAPENFCVALIVQRIMRRRSHTTCHHACSSGQSQSIDPLHFWWPETGGIPPLAFEIPQLFRRMDVRSRIDQPSCTSSAVQLRFRFGAAESLWLGEITSLRECYDHGRSGLRRIVVDVLARKVSLSLVPPLWKVWWRMSELTYSLANWMHRSHIYIYIYMI